MSKILRRSTIALAMAAVTACAHLANPSNLEPVDVGGGYQAQYRDPVEVTRDGQLELVSVEMNASGCRVPRGGPRLHPRGYPPLGVSAERVTRGDLLDIRVAQDDTFTGVYELSRDGSIRLPFLSPIRAQGRTVEHIEMDLADALVAGGFYTQTARVSVRLMDAGGVTVSVSGAVFEPRPVEIGGVSGDRVDTLRQSALGSSAEGRNLASALRAAGGIRPDADLSAVELRRGAAIHTFDLRPVLEGMDRADIPLLAGDEIFVPTLGCFQDHLMRPSPISPPGVTLFLSNLTVPASGNAVSAIGREVREIPYGTRFLQGVVDTNCVGGSRPTSAWRSAALLTRNPTTGVSTVIERNIEQMLRRADRDDFDPYLLPGDAIACYDSTVTGLGDLARVATQIVGATTAP